jgi:urease accessory protein UreH
MWNYLLAALLGATAVAAVCVTVYYITKKILEEEVRKYAERKYISGIIKAHIKAKSYNKVDVGLYDKNTNHLADLSLQAQNSVADDIREGDWLYVSV